MPTAHVNGVNIFYEISGKGFPLVWSHEFAGGYDSWDPQVNFFSRRYQVITYNHRGYVPSEVPTESTAYSQDHLVEDLYQLLLHLGISEAYIGGLSMGGAVALNFGLAHPDMAKGLIIAGAGTGATDPERLTRDAQSFANRIAQEGIGDWGEEYAGGPVRIQFKRKDPKGWDLFRRGLLSHSPLGTELILRGVQGKRRSLLSMGPELRQLQVPALILVGDEDEPCQEPALFLKKHIPRSGLVVFPQSGHTINLEEPAFFNSTVADFLTMVEAGGWLAPEEGTGFGFLVEEKSG